MQQLRRFDIEILRIISMLGIIAGHCFSFYDALDSTLRQFVFQGFGICKGVNPILIYFSLPIFTSIAGYLIGMQGLFFNPEFDYKRYVKKKIKRLYLPAIVFSLMYALFFNRSIIYEPFRFLLIFIQGQGHLWYLFMLFWLYCVSCPILLFARRVGYTFSIVMSFFICLVSCFFPLETTIFTILFYQFFFFIGVRFGRIHSESKVKRNKHGLTFRVLSRCFIYVFTFCLLAILKESDFSNSISLMSESLFYFQHWGFRLAIGVLSVFLAFSLLPFDVSNPKVVGFISSHCYLVYIIHQFLIIGFVRHFPEFCVDAWARLNGIFPLLLFLAVTIVSYILAVVAKTLPILRYI